jgi:hypothetical protein
MKEDIVADHSNSIFMQSISIIIENEDGEAEE